MDRSRARWSAAAAASAVVVVAASLAAMTARPRSSHAEGTPLFRFVAMADFTNSDIGDTRDRAGRGWNPGDPNSLDESWRRAIDVVLDEVEAERPAAVLVPGDLVNGEWISDPLKTGIFGPVTTLSQKLAAVGAAGSVYYRAYRWQFSYRGLRLLPALGDHDIGDNWWPRGSANLASVPAHKSVWAKIFTRRADGSLVFAQHPTGAAASTAYALRIADTLFVTVDEYAYSASGVRFALDTAQLSWLDRTLAAARAPGSGIDHIVVQGHLPVLGPEPSLWSSNLYMDGGVASPFWTLLERYAVDLYVTGELHVFSMDAHGGVHQVVSGSPTGTGRQFYVVCDVFSDRIELTVKSFSGTVTTQTRLWQMGTRAPLARVVYPRGARVAGTYVVNRPVMPVTPSASPTAR